ncbi:contact-dependent growth inhibition system immunity protein [Allomuricauda sp. R78024]|uniref:contact-dependent growth inhibition system immunity protein n=1 Tax=Allomuricauda sp. R78024 TaxID=3093867 RepID=UPI0037CB9536
MKFENNWREKTLEILEREQWREPSFDSHLVKTCHALRKKPLREFDNEDLRIMIGQNESLNYLMPLAIDSLKQNILSAGNFYEGDLLERVLKSDNQYWQREKDNWSIICDLFSRNEKLIMDSDLSDSLKKTLVESFSRFKKVN